MNPQPTDRSVLVAALHALHRPVQFADDEGNDVTICNADSEDWPCVTEDAITATERA